MPLLFARILLGPDPAHQSDESALIFLILTIPSIAWLLIRGRKQFKPIGFFTIGASVSVSVKSLFDSLKSGSYLVPDGPDYFYLSLVFLAIGLPVGSAWYACKRPLGGETSPIPNCLRLDPGAKFLASLLGAITAVSPIVVMCFISILGAFSEGARDDAPQRSAFVFLVSSVPIIFGCMLMATASSTFLFKQKLLTSIPALLLTSFIFPLAIVAAIFGSTTSDPMSFFTNPTPTLMSATAGACLCGGLFVTRWYLGRRTDPQLAK